MLLAPTTSRAAAERVLPAPHPDLPRCSATLDRAPIRSADSKDGQLLLSPPSVETSLDPGETARGCIVVENRGGVDLDLRLTTVDVVPPTSSSAGPTFGGETPWGAGDWLVPATSKTRIGPAELISIPFRVRVPADAEPGSHDGAILVAALPTGDEQVAIQSGLAAQVGIVVNGEVVRDGRLHDRSGPRVVRGGGSGTWSATWTNAGTVTDHVEAELVVRNSITDEVVKRVRFAKARVLRTSGRDIRLAWQDVPWIGRYSVELRVRTDGGTKVARYPAVWAVPPTWFIVLAIAAVLLPLLGWWLRRRRALHEAYVAELVELEVEERLSSRSERGGSDATD